MGEGEAGTWPLGLLSSFSTIPESSKILTTLHTLWKQSGRGECLQEHLGSGSTH